MDDSSRWRPANPGAIFIAIVALGFASGALLCADDARASDIQLTTTELGQIAQLDCGRRLVVCNFWIVPGSPWTFQSIFDAP